MASFRSRRDLALRIAAGALALIAAAVVVAIAVFVLLETRPLLSSPALRSLLSVRWLPEQQRFGLLALAVCSALVTLGAVALAAPSGILIAVLCRFYAPRALASTLGVLLELLAGIPSVVYGFWALVTLVPRIGQIAPPGPSLLAATIVLALMIVPTVAMLSHAALAAVPPAHILGAAALGWRRWSTIRHVVLPAARGGIASAVLLAAARALGETMAVLMVSGNVVAIPHGVFDPVRTLTSHMALEMGYATGAHRAALFAAALALLVATAALVLAAGRRERRARGG
ncbi:MAG: phosphate ABC transporter permease subunit PstC [Planctomycetota bacterium]|nr:MAG: phosphate ABC transporter permease subunit PstC [Planctomycetota bacterium]